jgi:hypothetical protein
MATTESRRRSVGLKIPLYFFGGIVKNSLLEVKKIRDDCTEMMV